MDIYVLNVHLQTIVAVATMILASRTLRVSELRLFVNGVFPHDPENLFPVDQVFRPFQLCGDHLTCEFTYMISYLTHKNVFANRCCRGIAD